MAVSGYILVEADIGATKKAGEGIQNLAPNGAKVFKVDTITGPFDIIVHAEADDLDLLGGFIQHGIQQVEGVLRTTTCLAVKLG